VLLAGRRWPAVARVRTADRLGIFMNIPLFRVDAFANEVFEGNPAAVCPLQSWIPDDMMRAIAAENNLPDTAFFVSESENYALRWFSPRHEVKLCGHATLASAFVIFNVLNTTKTEVHFTTQSGPLCVRQEGELLVMDFPSYPPSECARAPAELLKALHAAPERILQAHGNYFAVYANEEQIRDARPDFALLEKLHPSGVCITAPGVQADFVSRHFVPSYGVPEDPVTGSTHCSLTPYWANRMGKQQLQARQLSARGGELWLEVAGDRVFIKGKAVLYLAGTLSV
jgi:PhzF family phenazine biosynthesis protein